MGFGIASVGAILLVLALIIYLRVVGARLRMRERGDRTARLVVDQADTLVGFGRRADARALLEQALRDHPDSVRIRSRLDMLRAEDAERESAE